jgi:hypothetical protein
MQGESYGDHYVILSTHTYIHTHTHILRLHGFNIRHVKLTGKKWDNNLYRWHTEYVGGLKERSAKVSLENAAHTLGFRMLNRL